jgi:type II secretory pathway pseudopilin PulG
MKTVATKARPQTLSPCKASGFSIIELAVVLFILLIASTVLIPISRSSYQRDVLNQAISSLEGWLLEVSRSPDQTGQTCVVTFTTGGPLTRGSQIASVSPSTCANPSTVTLPTTQGQSFSVGASSATVSFTRRSAITSTSNVEVRVAVTGLTAMRCVRILGISGLVRMGRHNTSSTVNNNTGQLCNEWNVL